MDIKQLKYFRAIVTEGNITGAANRLFMTQPSLTHQLRLLENELGVRLINRGSRRITVTAAGGLLSDRAEQILALLTTTAAEVKDLHEGNTGSLAIGTIASSGVTLLPSLICDFHRRYPQVIFQLYEGDTPKILDLLKCGVIEIGIIRSVFDADLYDWLDLPPEPMIAASVKNAAGPDPAPCINLNELANQPLLVHHSNEMMLRECCRSAGFDPVILCKGEDVRTLLVLANEGLGLAILPKSALGLVPGNKLHYREIVDSPLVIKKAVIWLRNKFLSTAAKNFIQSIV